MAASLGVETGEGLLQTGAVVSGHPVSFPYSIITTSQYSGLSILDHATSAAQCTVSESLTVAWTEPFLQIYTNIFKIL